MDITALQFIAFAWIMSLNTICFIYYFITKDKEAVKFIGGLTVLSIAIISNNPISYDIAIPIAGLIIASERFMSMLVALTKGNEKFLMSDNFLKMLEKMSGKEINEKLNEEVQEIHEEAKEIHKEKFPNIDVSQSSREILSKVYDIKSLKDAEGKAIDKFASSIDFKLVRNMKLGNLLFDAVGFNQRNKKYYFIEVKTFSENLGDDKSAAEKIKSRLKNIIPKFLIGLSNEALTRLESRGFILMIILVINSRSDLKIIIDEMEKLKKELAIPRSKLQVKFIYYNLPKLLE